MARRGRPRGPILTKEEKVLGLDTCREMERLSAEELEKVIVQATEAIQQAKKELEANEHYQEAKGKLKTLSGGYRDLRKRQNMKIEYAVKLREEKGKA